MTLDEVLRLHQELGEVLHQARVLATRAAGELSGLLAGADRRRQNQVLSWVGMLNGTARAIEERAVIVKRIADGVVEARAAAAGVDVAANGGARDGHERAGRDGRP